MSAGKMAITLDEFAEVASLITARMDFPANSDEESLQMLRAWTELSRKSEGGSAVDEQ